jgi:hypothetical protein
MGNLTANEIQSLTFDGTEVKFEPVDGMPGMSIAHLHGDPTTGPTSQLAKLSAGFDTGWHTHDYDYEALVLKGMITRQQQGDRTAKELPVGSYYVQPASMDHRNTFTPRLAGGRRHGARIRAAQRVVVRACVIRPLSEPTGLSEEAPRDTRADDRTQ